MNDCCPVCKSADRTILGSPRTNTISAKFVDVNYKVVQCTNCQLYYITPPISFNNEQWAELYNSEYFSYQSNFLINRRKKELSERFDTAQKFVSSNTKKLNYLDVGAGEGKGLLEANRRGWEATGLDIVDNRMNEAKISGIKFIKSNLLDSNLQENYFDFIYVDSVVEHIFESS